MYDAFEIRELPISLQSVRNKIAAFLLRNDLRFEEVDSYVAVFAQEEDEMLAGAGIQGNTIKCVAVDEVLRGTGMAAKLISHLVCKAASEGKIDLKVFTKPNNDKIFESLGFKTIATSPKAIFMENSGDLETYCRSLKTLRKEGDCGIIVMNANPFTKGHRYLIEQAAQKVDHLFILVVREDKSQFAYKERFDMILEGTKDLSNVTVCEGSRYVISEDTFPTYFLKQVDEATAIHIHLDLTLFAKHIVPALGVTKRFVGTEPVDKLTCVYNQAMKELLPSYGIEVVEVERIKDQHAFAALQRKTDIKAGEEPVISASRLRAFLNKGDFYKAAAIAYPTTIPFLISELIEKALHTELETTPKPGLVDKKDNGAHKDMDFQMMEKSIKVLRPYFTKLAKLAFQNALPPFSEIQSIGLEAEKAMLNSTGGVNTYKGALFAMGIAGMAVAHTYYNKGLLDTQTLRTTIQTIAQMFPEAKGTHGEQVVKQHNVHGARAYACGGYADAFDTWVPFLRKHQDDNYCFHKTLLLIMSSLDDTNLYYRGGKSAVEKTKKQSQELLEHFSLERLEAMNEAMTNENISPGGAADMLSLTIFIENILRT